MRSVWISTSRWRSSFFEARSHKASDPTHWTHVRLLFEQENDTFNITILWFHSWLLTLISKIVSILLLPAAPYRRFILHSLKPGLTIRTTMTTVNALGYPLLQPRVPVPSDIDISKQIVHEVNLLPIQDVAKQYVLYLWDMFLYN